jgi:hypothetical protein
MVNALSQTAGMFYAKVMTLSLRNSCFKAGAAFSAITLGIIIAAAYYILPVYPDVFSRSVQGSSGILHQFIRNFIQPSPYVSFITTISAVIYSLIGIMLINYFFEKTQSQEILFIGLFVISFAFECIRIMVPLVKILELPMIYLGASSRILIFGRSFGLFSLFAASVFTSGLEVQKQEQLVFITAAAALIFAVGVPTDGLSWDTTLNIQYGFSSTFGLVEGGILVITMATFFISAYTRNSKEYIHIGLGALLIYIGRDLLLGGDTWLSPFLGLLILSLGTWLVCAKLHRIYLWL